MNKIVFISIGLLMLAYISYEFMHNVNTFYILLSLHFGGIAYYLRKNINTNKYGRIFLNVFFLLCVENIIEEIFLNPLNFTIKEPLMALIILIIAYVQETRKTSPRKKFIKIGQKSNIHFYG